MAKTGKNGCLRLCQQQTWRSPFTYFEWSQSSTSTASLFEWERNRVFGKKLDFGSFGYQRCGDRWKKEVQSDQEPSRTAPWAKTWYNNLTEFVKGKNFEFHVENPGLGKKVSSNGYVYILIHVDDMMFYGDVMAVNEFVTALKSRFEVSVSQIFEVGDEFKFLRKTYELEEDGLSIRPGRYSEDMIENFEKAYGEVKRQKLPAGPAIEDADGSNLMDPAGASLFRSLVGSGIYLAQERLDIAYTIKELASSMSNPTTGSIVKMKRLAGYLRETRGQYVHLPFPTRGQGIQIQSNPKWLLETFADADWSGSRGHRRSTSAAVHARDLPAFCPWPPRPFQCLDIPVIGEFHVDGHQVAFHMPAPLPKGFDLRIMGSILEGSWLL